MLEKLQQRFRPYAPLVLRIGIGLVFLLFALQKLSSPEQGRAEIQLLLEIGIGGAAALNFYLGIAELLVGLSLILGIYVRYVALGAAILAVTFFSGIISKYGFTQDPTLNRDLALIGGSIAVFLLGAGPLSLDRWFEKRKQQSDAPDQSSTINTPV